MEEGWASQPFIQGLGYWQSCLLTKVKRRIAESGEVWLLVLTDACQLGVGSKWQLTELVPGSFGTEKRWLLQCFGVDSSQAAFRGGQGSTSHQPHAWASDVAQLPYLSSGKTIPSIWWSCFEVKWGKAWKALCTVLSCGFPGSRADDILQHLLSPEQPWGSREIQLIN